MATSKQNTEKVKQQCGLFWQIKSRIKIKYPGY